MSIFLDSLWIWVGLSVLVMVIGYFVYQNDPRGRTLGIVVGVTILVFGIGLVLYYGIDTDRKSISRMLTGLATALEQDNLDSVLNNYISPKATGTRGMARLYMKQFHLTKANFRNLKLEVNQFVSPPLAKVSFLAVVYWKTKYPQDGFFIDTPQFQTIRFDIELEKTKDHSWVVTDKCDFDYRLQP
ncbi:MAG: hypothetical protein LBF88_02315 [Planctomycetaceae bacterium]|jgi:hypothetical protein|nr:hypothetical protein [Planctomycetaceae bacterium]